MKKNNLSLNFANPDTDLGKQQGEIRKKAKELTTNKSLHFFNGMLPVVIDGTGAKYDKIMSQKQALEEFGYDVSLLFVNTPLDVALERNAKRERSLDVDVVKKMWQAVQNNLGKFQQTFGDKMVIIDNGKVITDKKELIDFNNMIIKNMNKLINMPLVNRRGNEIIDMLKKYNKKYVSDLGDIKIKNFKI